MKESKIWKELQQRTKSFSIQIIKSVSKFPSDLHASIIGKQLIRSATSIGANYRAACRSRSKAEFTAKLGLVVEETDETIYWVELAKETGLFSKEENDILHEAKELLFIFSKSYKTSKRTSSSQNLTHSITQS